MSQTWNDVLHGKLPVLSFVRNSRLLFRDSRDHSAYSDSFIVYSKCVDSCDVQLILKMNHWPSSAWHTNSILFCHLVADIDSRFIGIIVSLQLYFTAPLFIFLRLRAVMHCWYQQNVFVSSHLIWLECHLVWFTIYRKLQLYFVLVDALLEDSLSKSNDNLRHVTIQ